MRITNLWSVKNSVTAEYNRSDQLNKHTYKQTNKQTNKKQPTTDRHRGLRYILCGVTLATNE